MAKYMVTYKADHQLCTKTDSFEGELSTIYEEVERFADVISVRKVDDEHEDPHDDPLDDAYDEG